MLGPYTEIVKLVLCVIDGLAPAALERALEAGRLPALGFVAEHGEYRRGVSTFPSVTPVCLSAIATGGGPDVHGIPHLVWWNAEEGRLVEYGSSLGAVLAAGLTGAVRDAVLNMSGTHLSRDATTVFEALEDRGLTTAAITFTCYRGRTRHEIRLPAPMRRGRWYEAVNGPSRFYFFNLYESDETGAPLAVRSRTEGSVDRYAVHAGRWLVTRDGFDFLVYYLPDYDYASHVSGPDAADAALARADAAVGQLMEAAGGYEAFLERYALVVCSDHAQSRVDKAARLEDRFDDLRLLAPRRRRPDRSDLAVCASNRSAMLYRLPGCQLSARDLAGRLDQEPAADVVLFREDG
jgi:predicted AlkP superfamily pyrophosphatase or phosphodiesterase